MICSAPIRVAVDPDRRAGAQFGDKVSHVVRVRKSPAGWRFVQRDAEQIVAGGGDGRRHVEDFADTPGQIVGAVMSAQQGRDRRAILGERQHRGVNMLVVERGREMADDDPRRAQRHHRIALTEMSPKRRAHIIKRPDTRRGYPFRIAVDNTAQFGLQTTGGGEAGLAQNQIVHGVSLDLRTRIMAK